MPMRAPGLLRSQRRTVGRSSRPVILRPATVEQLGPVSCRGVLGARRKTCAAVVDSILKKPSSTAVSLLQETGAGIGKTRRGEGTKIVAVADGHRPPIRVWTESATPQEVKVVIETLAGIFGKEP